MLVRNYLQIEIPKRGQMCTQDQGVLAPGSDYYSVLIEDEEKGFVRQDFCPACWERFARQETISHARSHWKSKVPLKKEETLLPRHRDERAMVLLKHALGKNDEESLAEAFVLSLYLARKRILLLRQELRQEDGQLAQLYEVAETEEMIWVKKVNLPTLQTGKVQLELAKKFKPSATLESV